MRVSKLIARLPQFSWAKHLRSILVSVALATTAVVVATAAPADIAKGVAWLQSQVLSTGALSAESKTATTPQAQCETAATLLQLVGNNAQLAALMGAIQGAANDKSPTETLACTQLLAQRLGQVATSDLLAPRRLPNGSYRAYADFNVGNALDTGWALEGQLRSLSSPEQTLLLTWLQSQQSSEGSFLVNGSPKLLSTAIVLRGLKGITSQNAVAAAVAEKAAAYLLGKRSASAGWLDDVATTAIVFEAVHPYTGSDPTIATSVGAYLVSQQQADGSWKSDTYLSAVALRALALTGTLPTDPTAALSTARLQGQVVRAATGTPLANVLINVFSSGVLVAATPADSQGRYTLTGLATGPVQVVASLASYQTVTGILTLAAQDVALFSPAMFAVEQTQTPLPSSVGQTTLTGAQIFAKVTNAQNNTPLAGVTVSLQTPGSATLVLTTGNDGSFDTRVVAGEVTITYVLSGFVTQIQHALVSDGAVINAGTIAMKAKVSGAQIFGKVTSAQINAPLSGVSVMVGLIHGLLRVKSLLPTHCLVSAPKHNTL
jgi:Carboxypeptidase regulatory-like domain